MGVWRGALAGVGVDVGEDASRRWNSFPICSRFWILVRVGLGEGADDLLGL